MSTVTVEISDLKVSAKPDDVLITYALGSCIAVIVHDPLRKVGGMITTCCRSPRSRRTRR